MVLATGCCHPVGEDASYDGLYLKRNEMPGFAAALRGMPIYVEHDSNRRVGTIDHAWTTDDDALHVLFETDESNFAGHLAANLIKQGLCHELSLGHDVTIAQSAGEPSRVTGKTPNEVSLVVKGARDNTRIHAWGRNTRASDPTAASQYIFRTQDDDAPTMDSVPTDATTTTPTAPAETEVADQRDVMNELRQQADTNARMSAQLAELQSQLGEYKKVGQKRRSDAISGGVKDWFDSIVAKFPKEMGAHSDKFSEIFKAMAQNDEAEPMVQLLSCAATAHKSSTVALEKKYQEERSSWDSERKRMKTQLDASKPAFAEPKERFEAPIAPSAPDAYNRMFGEAPQVAAAQRGSGMRGTNPAMYNTLMKRASAMPDGGSKQAFDTSLYSSARRAKLGW